MGETITAARTKVVDLASYRAKRAQRELPLFVQPAGPGWEPNQAPARTLVPHEVEHRKRMLRFLGSTS